MARLQSRGYVVEQADIRVARAEALESIRQREAELKRLRKEHPKFLRDWLLIDELFHLPRAALWIALSDKYQIAGEGKTIVSAVVNLLENLEMVWRLKFP